jgi:hypothetical protein
VSNLVICILCGGMLLLTNKAQDKVVEKAAAVLGTWEGESRCKVSDSACRDEHVIYEIVRDQKSVGGLRIDGYKVVAAKKQFMGPLQCKYEEKNKKLECTADIPRKNRWEFTVSGDVMTGTLVVDEGTLFREIRVTRKN